PNDGRDEVAERAPEHVLRPAAPDQLAAGEREAKLDEPVVEEGHAGLDRVRHRVPVLIAEELREPAPGQDQLLVAPKPVGERGAVRSGYGSEAAEIRVDESAGATGARADEPRQRLGCERPRHRRHERRRAVASVAAPQLLAELPDASGGEAV